MRFFFILLFLQLVSGEYENEILFHFAPGGDIRVNTGTVFQFLTNPILIEESLWVRVNLSLKPIEDHLLQYHVLYQNIGTLCQGLNEVVQGGIDNHWTDSLRRQEFSVIHSGIGPWAPNTNNHRLATKPIAKQFPSLEYFSKYMSLSPQMAPFRWYHWRNVSLSDQRNDINDRYHAQVLPKDMLMSETAFYRYYRERALVEFNSTDMHMSKSNSSRSKRADWRPDIQVHSGTTLQEFYGMYKEHYGWSNKPKNSKDRDICINKGVMQVWAQRSVYIQNKLDKCVNRLRKRDYQVHMMEQRISGYGFGPSVPLFDSIKLCQETQSSFLLEYQLITRQLLLIFEQNQIEPVDGILRTLLAETLEHIPELRRRRRSPRKWRKRKKRSPLFPMPRLYSGFQTVSTLRNYLTSGAKLKKVATVTSRFRSLMKFSMMKTIGKGILRGLGPVGGLISAYLVDRRLNKLTARVDEQGERLDNLSKDLGRVALVVESNSIAIDDLMGRVRELSSQMAETKAQVETNTLVHTVMIQIDRIKLRVKELSDYMRSAILELSLLLTNIDNGNISYVIDEEIALFMSTERSSSTHFAPHPYTAIVMSPKYEGGNLRFYCNILISTQTTWEMWKLMSIPISSQGKMYRRKVPYKYALTNIGEDRFIPLYDNEEIKECMKGICLYTRGPAYPIEHDHCGISLNIKSSDAKDNLEKCQYEEMPDHVFMQVMGDGVVYSSGKKVEARMNCRGKSGVPGSDAHSTLPASSSFFRLHKACSMTLSDEPRATIFREPKETVADISITIDKTWEAVQKDSDPNDYFLELEISRKVNSTKMRTERAAQKQIDTSIKHRFTRFLKEKTPAWLKKGFLITLGIVVTIVVALLILTACGWASHSWVGVIYRGFKRFRKRSSRRHIKGYRLFHFLAEMLKNPKDLRDYLDSAETKAKKVGHSLKEKAKRLPFVEKLAKYQRAMKDLGADHPRLGGRPPQSGEDSDGDEILPPFLRCLQASRCCCRCRDTFEDDSFFVTYTRKAGKLGTVGPADRPANVEFHAAYSKDPLIDVDVDYYQYEGIADADVETEVEDLYEERDPTNHYQSIRKGAYMSLRSNRGEPSKHTG